MPDSYWTRDDFPELTQDWFRQIGVRDPDSAFEKWQRWRGERKRGNEQLFRKALSLGAGVGKAAVGFWLTKERNPDENLSDHLSGRTLIQLDQVSTALGRPPWNPIRVALAPDSEGRIVLLAELSNVPSPRYHLSVIASIVRACEHKNFSVALHAVSQADPNLPGVILRILRNSRAQGMVWFRLTPDPACLRAVSEYSPAFPCVLVHASRLRYPPPVIAHIVPGQAGVAADVERWARGLTPAAGRCSVVVAAMEPEELRPEFDPIDATVPASIRAERIALAIEGIRACRLEPVRKRVNDYSAANAYDLIDPGAAGYLCFSDEIAVALKQLLLARGEDPNGRILGFDGTDLARKFHIPSFDQKLDEIGDAVVEQFLLCAHQTGGASSGLPAFRELETPLRLSGLGASTSVG